MCCLTLDLLVFKSYQVLQPRAFPQAGVVLTVLSWAFSFQEGFYFKKKMEECISLGK